MAAARVAPLVERDPVLGAGGAPRRGGGLVGDAIAVPGAPEVEARNAVTSPAAAIAHRRCLRGRDLTGREYSLILGPVC